jgi:hypothetical protein
MNRTANERSAAWELIWSLSTTTGADEKQALKLEYEVKALEELYVGDRLWDYDKDNRIGPDPFGVYRFVHNGSLRLVFAQAPHSPDVMPRVVYTPFYTRIQAGEVHKGAVLIALPVDEYSSLARNTNAPTVAEEISRVTFVLSYRLRSTMDRDPAPHSKNAKYEGYVVHGPQTIVSTMEVDRLPVKRRTGYMARFALPGEPEPGSMPR